MNGPTKFGFVLLLLISAFRAQATLNYRYDSAGRSISGTPETQIGVTTGNRSVSSLINAPGNFTVVKIATDPAGNTYAALVSDTRDALLARIDPFGRTLFTVTLAGSGDDTLTAVAVDTAGNIYAGGSSTSSDFPLRGALQTARAPGLTTGFLTKLSPDGSQILYSTFFGGTNGTSSVTALTADALGLVYVAGTTNAQDYPTTAGLPADRVTAAISAQISGAFFAQISPAGDRVLYSGLLASANAVCSGGSTCFLSPRYAIPVALGLDAAGDLYIAGNTNTRDLGGSAPGFRTTGAGPFVARIDSPGSAMHSLTYLTLALTNTLFGTSATTLNGMAVSKEGNVTLAGYTTDDAFPVTPGTLQSTRPGLPFTNNEGFVAKLSPELDRLIWGTYLGGHGVDMATAIAEDTSGKLWVTGRTNSVDFPGLDGGSSSTDFLVALNETGTALTYAARYGSGTVSSDVVSPAAGIVHAAASFGLISAIDTNSAASPYIFLVTNAAGRTSRQVAPGEIISIYGQGIGFPATLVASPANGFYPKNLGAVQVLVNGVAAPLLFVSANQINAVVPLGVTGGTAAIQVGSVFYSTQPFAMALQPASPGIFRINETDAVILNQDGTINSVSNPAPRGSIAAMWVTGVEGVDAALSDGEVQRRAFSVKCCKVSVSNLETMVLYSGDAPQTVTGLTQINFLVPDVTSRASVSVMSGDQTDSALFYVK